MPATKTKRFKVIPNPDLLQAGRGFVPAFGNDADLHIINRLIALEKLLPLVDNKIMRGGDATKLTSKMKQILTEERYLIDSITSRNLDF